MSRSVNVVIWSALALSQGAYLLIPSIWNPWPPGQGPAPAVPDLFAFVLMGVALAESVAVVALLRLRVLGPIQTGHLDPSSPEAAAKLFPILVICWVLAESVALYGLVLRLLGFGVEYAVPFALLAVALLLWARPWQAGLLAPSSSADLARSGRPLA